MLYSYFPVKATLSEHLTHLYRVTHLYLLFFYDFLSSSMSLAFNVYPLLKFLSLQPIQVVEFFTFDDINDNAPMFMKQPYRCSVKEVRIGFVMTGDMDSERPAL